MSEPEGLGISTHSRAKAAGTELGGLKSSIGISTHSRAKAAGMCRQPDNSPRCNFNSQPREGGWVEPIPRFAAAGDFNSQPREGGWKDVCTTTTA